MAGIIGASLNEFGIGGVAPEAEMIALRACRQVVDQYPEAGCTTASVAKAIDTAIEKRARVVNMSFGSAASDKLIFKLIEEGSKRGILFVAVVLSELGDLVNPTQTINIFKDEPDHRIMECALSGKAEAIVTGDNRMRKVREYMGLRVISPKEYLES